MESLKLKDFLNYRFLSGVQYAPDGSKAAFVAANANEEENLYERRLWLWDGQLRQLTDLGQEGSVGSPGRSSRPTTVSPSPAARPCRPSPCPLPPPV